MSLRHIIDEYLDFQKEIIVRRTRYDLRKAQERAHLLEGLLIAQDNIDEVIQIIKTSETTAKAKATLRERFDLSDEQAQAILDMQLRRLSGLNREKILQEHKDLCIACEEYRSILADDSKKLNIIENKSACKNILVVFVSSFIILNTFPKER